MALSLALGLAEFWVLLAVAAEVARLRQRKRVRLARQEAVIARRLQSASSVWAANPFWRTEAETSEPTRRAG